MNKYKRAADTMRNPHLAKVGEVVEATLLATALLDLAAQLPEGEAEALLKAAIERAEHE